MRAVSGGDLRPHSVGLLSRREGSRAASAAARSCDRRRSAARSRSWTSTCSPVIVPSAESREIASWMCARGIRRVRSATACLLLRRGVDGRGEAAERRRDAQSALDAVRDAVRRLDTGATGTRRSATTRPGAGAGASASRVAGANDFEAAPLCAWACACSSTGAGRRRRLLGAWARRTTTAATIAANAGTATTRVRRQVKRRGGDGAAATIWRTCSRTCAGAAMRAPCSSATRSRCDMEGLLELLECAVEPRGAVRGRDAEHARCGRRVDVEHDAQRDHLTLAGGQGADGCFELG